MASVGESTATRKWTSIKYEMGQLIIIHSKFAIRFVEALQHFARSDAYNLWHLHAEINLIKLLFCFFRTFFSVCIRLQFYLLYVSLAFHFKHLKHTSISAWMVIANLIISLSYRLKTMQLRFETLHISH